MMRRALSAAVLLAAVATSRGAMAGDAALAESLFRQGRELMEKGDYAAACPKLSESFAQDPATGTLLALAMCQEQAGQTASAWAGYAEVISRAKRDGRTDREQAARDHLQALDPKLSRLTIEVDASAASVPGLVVKRDGLPVGNGAWGASSPVDPGEHVVEATAPHKRAWKASVTIGGVSDSQTVKVPSLVDEPAEGAAAAQPQASPAAPTAAMADSAAPSTAPPLRTVGLVVGGAGIVGLGLSGYFGLHASSLNSDSKSGGHCDANNTCDATGLAKRNDAVSASNIATIALVAGGVLTAAGVTLFLVGGRKDAKADTARVEATPAVGPGVAAVLVRGRF
jgi:hypothetical protein